MAVLSFFHSLQIFYETKDAHVTELSHTELDETKSQELLNCINNFINN